jgi:hypothetical protein
VPVAEARVGPLGAQLYALRRHLAQAAQRVYNEWQPDEEFDDLAGGGICQDVAAAMAEVISRAIPTAETSTVSATTGEQHVWVVTYGGQEAYEIDIPYWLYEAGGGYSWEKIPEVQLRSDDVVISPIPIEHAIELIEYEG